VDYFDPSCRPLASIAFIAACRIAWLIGRDPKVPDQFVLSLVKNNLEQVPPSLANRIVAAATPRRFAGSA
jgi:hypothetical protein